MEKRLLLEEQISKHERLREVLKGEYQHVASELPSARDFNTVFEQLVKLDKDGVRCSRSLVALLTKNYFTRKWCIQEMRWPGALQHRKTSCSCT
jgi:hypothetical protein